MFSTCSIQVADPRPTACLCSTILTHGWFCRLQDRPGQHILTSLVFVKQKPSVRQYKKILSIMKYWLLLTFYLLRQWGMEVCCAENHSRSAIILERSKSKGLSFASPSPPQHPSQLLPHRRPARVLLDERCSQLIDGGMAALDVLFYLFHQRGEILVLASVAGLVGHQFQ